MRDTEKLLFFKFSSPKAKISICRPLGKRYNANEFIKAAWKGYSRELESKYNFDSALEWLIESNSSTLFETQYLHAITCLEMLMLLVFRYPCQISLSSDFGVIIMTHLRLACYKNNEKP